MTVDVDFFHSLVLIRKLDVLCQLKPHKKIIHLWSFVPVWPQNGKWSAWVSVLQNWLQTRILDVSGLQLWLQMLLCVQWLPDFDRFGFNQKWCRVIFELKVAFSQGMCLETCEFWRYQPKHKIQSSFNLLAFASVLAASFGSATAPRKDRGDASWAESVFAAHYGKCCFQPNFVKHGKQHWGKAMCRCACFHRDHARFQCSLWQTSGLQLLR